MRIIGYVEHPSLKITVFHMNNRISVQFETGTYSQIYKFRESDQLKNIQQVQALVDESFIQSVQENFVAMHKTQNAAMSKFLTVEGQEDEFEEII